jgi:hypothetical protein
MGIVVSAIDGMGGVFAWKAWDGPVPDGSFEGRVATPTFEAFVASCELGIDDAAEYLCGMLASDTDDRSGVRRPMLDAGEYMGYLRDALGKEGVSEMVPRCLAALAIALDMLADYERVFGRR